MKRLLKRIFLGALIFFAIFFAVFFILVALPVPAPLIPNKTLTPFAITNVSVIDIEAGSLIPGQTVVIEKGQITNIGPTASIIMPENAIQIDATGKFLIPGLWDMHAHLGTKMSPQLTLPLFIAGGVTNIRELGGVSLDYKRGIHQKILSGALIGPRLMGYASAFVASLDSRDQAVELVTDLIDSKPGFIKVYNQLLPEYYFSLIEEAKKQGITVLGHKPRAVSAIDGANAGHKSFEHARLFLFECYPGASQLRERYRARYSGEVSMGGRIIQTSDRREMIDNHSPDLFDELATVMVENGTWFVPTHITRKMDAFADNEAYRQDARLSYIQVLQRYKWNSDADGMIEQDPSPEGRKAFMDFYLKGLELTGKAHRAGVKILAGTDANDTYCFPGLGIHDELQELVKAGLTPIEALKTATLNPAEYFGVSADYGSIASGKVADLMLLDANPLENISNTAKIDKVIFNGNVYTRKELDNMLAYVAGNASSLSISCKLIWQEISE